MLRYKLKELTAEKEFRERRRVTVQEIAEASGRTPAQVVLRWHIQHGLVAIPRSSHPQRIAENLDIFDFELSDEQMELIDSMDESEPS